MDLVKQAMALLTGHGHPRKYLLTLRINNDPVCELCKQSTETAKHIILECEGLEARGEGPYSGLYNQGMILMLPWEKTPKPH